MLLLRSPFRLSGYVSQAILSRSFAEDFPASQRCQPIKGYAAETPRHLQVPCDLPLTFSSALFSDFFDLAINLSPWSSVCLGARVVRAGQHNPPQTCSFLPYSVGSRHSCLHLSPTDLYSFQVFQIPCFLLSPRSITCPNLTARTDLRTVSLSQMTSSASSLLSYPARKATSPPPFTSSRE